MHTVAGVCFAVKDFFTGYDIVYLGKRRYRFGESQRIPNFLKKVLALCPSLPYIKSRAEAHSQTADAKSARLLGRLAQG